MLFSELPQPTQDKLRKEQLDLCNHNVNDPWHILLYNAAGTRYIMANRRATPWCDDKGHSMPFGGGTQWSIRYGVVQFHRVKNPIGETDYQWITGKPFGAVKGITIPRTLNTKQEVVELIKSIGIFNL